MDGKWRDDLSQFCTLPWPLGGAHLHCTKISWKKVFISIAEMRYF
jgi:hypothetical protein